MLASFREWLRSDMKAMRWVFLGVYLLLPAGLLLGCLMPSGPTTDAHAIFAGLFLGAQAVFIFGGGTDHLCEPIRPAQLWMPVAVAAAVLAMVLLGAALTLLELFAPRIGPSGESRILLLVICSWPLWGVLLWFFVRRRQRYSALGRLAAILIAASIAELIVAVPSCLIVYSRRIWLGGLLTMLAIVVDIIAMAFAFGPLIVLLFLRPRYRRELMARTTSTCPACAYDLRGTLAAGSRTCPECGAAIPANAVALPLT
jgi:hypothetical protein